MRAFRTIILIGFLLLNELITAQVPYFRGAWIATVARIDWPSQQAVGKPWLQHKEMIDMLDSLHSIGVNAVIFQVRPTADALYYSELEPWSHWITGRQGYWPQQYVDSLAPDMVYDPLQMVIEEAHRRDMQVHAWLNPYRVNINGMDTARLAPNHILRLHPEWFFRYGQQWLFNPALPETREWISMVVEDIVCRYEVDAIHMDDYFYPYPIAGKTLPDQTFYMASSRGIPTIEDWRRDNVNLAIEEISHTIRSTRSGVQFGISPFGVWRNMDKDTLGSSTRAGLTNYDDLYADILLWIRKGWIDYVVPQLYWEIGKPIADYAILAKWWADAVTRENAVAGADCQLYIGMAPYRLGGKKDPSAWRLGNEIARQMRLNRTIPAIHGECFYSTAPLLKNPLHVCDSIRTFPIQKIEKKKN